MAFFSYRYEFEYNQFNHIPPPWPKCQNMQGKLSIGQTIYFQIIWRKSITFWGRAISEDDLYSKFSTVSGIWIILEIICFVCLLYEIIKAFPVAVCVGQRRWLYMHCIWLDILFEYWHTNAVNLLDSDQYIQKNYS